MSLQSEFGLLRRAVGNMFLKRRRKSRLSTLVSIGLGVLVFAAAQWQPEAVAQPETLGKVVYDPSTGSYFETMRNVGRIRNWRTARTAVNKRIYKGLRGRLAVIKTRATHEFLRKNLGIPFNAWIGLRYHCSSGKLVWVTGEILRRGVDFEIWHRQLYYEGQNFCVHDVKHLVVFYIIEGRRLYWRVSGPEHYLTGTLIEYPTR